MPAIASVFPCSPKVNPLTYGNMQLIVGNDQSTVSQKAEEWQDQSTSDLKVSVPGDSLTLNGRVYPYHSFELNGDDAEVYDRKTKDTFNEPATADQQLAYFTNYGMELLNNLYAAIHQTFVETALKNGWVTVATEVEEN